MKILFLSDNYPPETNAPAIRTAVHCREWMRHGETVTVITSAPNFPTGIVHAGYRNLLWQKSCEDGVRVVRVWTFIAANKGFVLRTLDFISFAVSAWIAGLFCRADIIVGTSPQFFTAVAAYGLALIKRKPWVFEVRDLWPESIVAVGLLKEGSAIHHLLEAIELHLYRNATKIVVVSEAFVPALVRRGVDPGKIVVVPNGVDGENFHAAGASRTVTIPHPPGTCLVGYIGTHGAAHGLDFILRCAAEVANEPFHFLFIGEGAMKNALMAQAKHMQLRNVSFLPPVPHDLVPVYLAGCDIILVNLKRSETFRSVIPSKIFEAAAAERPILIGVDGEARRIVENFGAGLYFEPENAAGFVHALRTLGADAGLNQRLKSGSQQLAAAYDRKRLAAAMLELLRGVRRTTAGRKI